MRKVSYLFVCDNKANIINVVDKLERYFSLVWNIVNINIEMQALKCAGLVGLDRTSQLVILILLVCGINSLFV